MAVSGEEAAMRQGNAMMEDQVQASAKIFRRHLLLGVLEGTAGAFGGAFYKSAEWVRENTRVIDGEGTCYLPKAEDELDEDTQSLLRFALPGFVSELGAVGQNMHFLWTRSRRSEH